MYFHVVQRVEKWGKVYSMDFNGQSGDQSTLTPYCANDNWTEFFRLDSH